ncbi:PLDc N-terminal domain-containing protein [Sediminicola luteus]
MYCLVEIFRSQNKSENKFLWVLIVFFIPLIGSLVYINRSRINNTNTY